MLKGVLSIGLAGALSLFGAAPTSTNFTLQNYDFGNGGGSTSSSNYKLNVSTGTQSGDGSQSSTNYKVKGGLQSSQTSNVPPAPAFTNPSNEYSRLKLVINTGGNPSDTKFQVAISPDAFATTTRYVQTDNTVGSLNDSTTYQTYASWGGATGVWVTGLTAGTTYTVKVRALQGGFSGSAFGPTASAATVSPSLTFSVATSLTATPPFAITFASLPAGAVTTGNATANIGLTTNSLAGGVVYVMSTGGLTSSRASATIASATADLSVVSTGYGAIVSTASQASGGPFTGVSPFNGAGSNVGALTTSLQPILSTAAAITTGTATIDLKAKAASTTPSSSDYTDTLTFVAAMLY